MNCLNQSLKQILSVHADQNHALEQQAYMKSALPFWGIRKPDLDKIAKPFIKNHQPSNNEQYRSTITALFWHAQHREEWYVALMYARHYKKHIRPENIDLYIDIIRHAQWWDITDVIAPHLIGTALAKDSELLQAKLNEWIADECFWISRTALLTQLHYKKNTDFGLLSSLILKISHHKEFFIRKAIGWALRELSKTDALLVQTWVEENKDRLSNLSYTQALKRIRLADARTLLS